MVEMKKSSEWKSMKENNNTPNERKIGNGFGSVLLRPDARLVCQVDPAPLFYGFKSRLQNPT
jgi:hypothetical protein